jgi:hypothetical protein
MSGGGQAVWLINSPRTDSEWAIWSYHHYISHTAIRQAIQAKKAVNLVDYAIDPINPSDITGFLQRNAQLHLEMNGVLGLPSQDIQDVDLSDERQKIAWIEIHHHEHFDAEAALGL